LDPEITRRATGSSVIKGKILGRQACRKAISRNKKPKRMGVGFLRLNEGVEKRARGGGTAKP